MTSCSRRRLLLPDDEVHSAAIGEIACGNLRHRSEALASLRLLPAAAEANTEELLTTIETERLHGLGIGWIDVQLRVSARLSGARLWTLHRRLQRISGPASPGN
jgi:hypothetical protein